jgi:hypothetical protein
MEREMTTNTKPEIAIGTTKPSVRARIESAYEVAAGVSGAFSAGGKAYVADIFEICRALGGFGREILTEAGEHFRATRSRRWPRS